MTITRPLSVEEICEKLRPIMGKKIDELYFMYKIAKDNEEREEIENLLNILYKKKINDLLSKPVLLEPPAEKIIDGEYVLANVFYSDRSLFPFRLRELDWPRHVCISGMSGSGKTTLAFKILLELIKNKKPFLVFDWKKSFRPLIEADSSIMLFTIGNDSVSNLFKINVNEPPKGVSPKEWINVLTDLLTESFSASFGVHKVILETLDEAFKEWGVYNGSENYPTWNHIKWRLEEKLQKASLREAGWIESSLRIATVLTFGDFGKTINYKGKTAFKVEEILGKRVIMELNSLGNIEKKFFCEFILTYVYKMKKASNKNYSCFENAILVDEAHNIFLKKPTNFANESVTDMIYREMREYGTSLICLDQHISKISDCVKGNSACHIAFQQQLPEDIEEISGIMHLKEKPFYFSQLPIGFAIVKLTERYNNPFLIRVEKVPLREILVDDNKVKSRMQAVLNQRDFEKGVDKKFNESIVYKKNDEGLSNSLTYHLKSENKSSHSEKLSEIQELLYKFVFDYLKSGVSLEDIRRILEESKSSGGYTTQDIEVSIEKAFKDYQVVTFKKDKIYEYSVFESRNNNVSQDEQKFLEFLRLNPSHELSTVEVYQRIGLSRRKGNKIKKQLEGKGLIQTETIKYEKGWKKFIRLKNS